MAKRKGSNNRIRIIGGEWRSRQLPFIEAPGLRPTPDRVRETLFNWLQGKVAGAHCLDLFSGSGAIAFEALSRYADKVVLVEKHAAVAQQLKENIDLLGAESSRVNVINMDASKYLEQAEDAFDLIFLDPPFRKGFVDEVMTLILADGLLKPDGMIYLEYEMGLEPDFEAWGMSVFRETRAGQVVSVLLRSDVIDQRIHNNSG